MNKIIIEKNSNYLVNKNEKLLLSQHRLSVNALKIMSCLICMIRKNDKDFKEYIFTSQDYKKLIDSKSKNIMLDMVKASKELQSTNIKIDLEKSILETNMIISQEYLKGNGSFLKLMLHPKLIPFLLDLKNKYLSYDIQNILSLKSNYSIKLYELLKHKYNQSIKHTKNPIITFSIEIDKLRDMFQVPKSYNLHKIKLHILEKSKNEFSEKTDIFFEYDLFKKLGRKYDTITFSIGKNKI